MQLIRGLTNLLALAGQPDSPLRRGCVATIGNFDGVHLGHQTIIDQVRDKAHQLGVPAVVMVFEPQPREYFEGDQAPPRLTAFRQKWQALLQHGTDIVVCLRFNERFRQYSGLGFIEEVLVGGLHIRHLVVGDDFRFGCDRNGDFDLLQAQGEVFGYSVERTRTVMVAGERVSSTRVRDCLQAGGLAQAASLLGEPYGIEGRVVYGRQLGRQLDAPTANIRLARMPALRGVYVITATTEQGERYHGVANIGLRPTVDGKHPALEAHLFGYSGSLYGQRLHVGFRHFLRGEQKFDNVEALKGQILEDITQARAWLACQPTSID
ncbi:MAG: bifunctional riboflavin kinase/FAD synthetase [Marinobacter sp.]|nr:bifunctional riboflavin kinase/FAD synthetase [Marinobacter sp.]